MIKYKYGKKVKITSGFYKGKKGKIHHTVKILFFSRMYLIELDDMLTEWINEKDIEECKC